MKNISSMILVALYSGTFAMGSVLPVTQPEPTDSSLTARDNILPEPGHYYRCDTSENSPTIDDLGQSARNLEEKKIYCAHDGYSHSQPVNESRYLHARPDFLFTDVLLDHVRVYIWGERANVPCSKVVDMMRDLMLSCLVPFGDDHVLRAGGVAYITDGTYIQVSQ
jgi:hypothetical protein